MRDSAESVRLESSDIDIAEILRLLWRRKILIACVVAGSLVLASLYLHTATYQYTAQLKLTPTDSSGGSSLSSRLGALGGLASAAGFNLSSGESLSPFELYVESIRSLDVARELTHDSRIMTTLFEGEWDERAATWKDPGGSLRGVVNAIKTVLGAPVYPWRPPDAQRLQEYLESAVRVEENTKKAIVTLTYQHPDPEFAAYLLTALDGATDRLLRQKTLARAKEYISFLSEKLESTSIAELRSDIADALSEQEKLVVYASSNSPFAAQSFGDAISSPRPTEPKPVLTLILSIALGTFCGALLVLVMEGMRRRSAIE